MFGGTGETLSAPTTVVVRGNVIAAIGPDARPADDAILIDGTGQTLMPGLIDSGTVMGPRIWPSGLMISQTSGHADLRQPNEPSRRFSGKLSKVEEIWASVIADDRDEVLTAVRENLRMGASQIKIAAGGGPVPIMIRST